MYLNLDIYISRAPACVSTPNWNGNETTNGMTSFINITDNGIFLLVQRPPILQQSTSPTNLVPPPPMRPPINQPSGAVDGKYR